MPPDEASQNDDTLNPVRDVRRFSRTYSAGERIFAAGDAGHCMYVLTAGSVAISVGADAEDVEIHRLGVGECFGEIALLEDGVRTATATAMASPTTVLEVDKARFVYLVGQQPAFALTVMRSLARRVQGRAMAPTRVSP
jgi:CRP/FNR family cyclic AMP-dependent transcriptional regulator